jgi:hypothetical protein
MIIVIWARSAFGQPLLRSRGLVIWTAMTVRSSVVNVESHKRCLLGRVMTGPCADRASHCSVTLSHTSALIRAGLCIFLLTGYPAAARAPSWCCGPGMDPIDRAACIEAITVCGSVYRIVWQSYFCPSQELITLQAAPYIDNLGL